MNEIENELKHWGILGMKWGVRNYQNPDGSLTPLGRIRYGVGPKKNVTGNVLGANDAGSLSDEELKKMTRRYQNQADYYQARNNYIYQENRYKENTAPKPKGPSVVSRFMSNVIGRPLENFMAKNVEFALGAIGYRLLEGEHPEAAVQYLNSISGMNMKYKTPADEKREKRKQYLDDLDLENKIREAEKKRDDPNYSSLNKKESFKDTVNKTKYYDERKRMEDLMNKNFNDPDISNDEIMESIRKWKYVYGNDKPIY